MGIRVSKMSKLRFGAVAVGFVFAALATSPAAAGDFGKHTLEKSSDPGDFTIVTKFAEGPFAAVEVLWCKAKDNATVGTYWRFDYTSSKPECDGASRSRTVSQRPTIKLSVERRDGWNKVIIGSGYPALYPMHHVPYHESRTVLEVPAHSD